MRVRGREGKRGRGWEEGGRGRGREGKRGRVKRVRGEDVHGEGWWNLDMIILTNM